MLVNELINDLDPMQDWSVILLKVCDATNISGNDHLSPRFFTSSIKVSQFVVAQLF
jgi:hypothetical protein